MGYVLYGYRIRPPNFTMVKDNINNLFWMSWTGSRIVEVDLEEGWSWASYNSCAKQKDKEHGSTVYGSCMTAANISPAASGIRLPDSNR
ncbi:hypothetical protein ACMFMF_006713 [Clarireedia jacksonii]